MSQDRYAIKARSSQQTFVITALSVSHVAARAPFARLSLAVWRLVSQTATAILLLVVLLVTVLHPKVSVRMVLKKTSTSAPQAQNA